MEPLLGAGPALSVGMPTGPGRDGLLELLRLEQAEMLVELGVPLHFGDAPLGADDQLECVVDESTPAPQLVVDSARRRVEARGATLDACAAALSLIRTARRTGRDRLVAVPADAPSTAIELVADEIATTWPSFGLAGIEWSAMAQGAPSADSPDVVGDLQRWVARLGDGHTNVHARGGIAALPYTARVQRGSVVFGEVPVGTAAWHADVRRGDELCDVDVADIWDRVGAPPRLRPWLVGRRVLSGPAGVPVDYVVQRRDGSTVTLRDTPGEALAPPPIEWRRLPSGTAYLRIRRWVGDDVAVIDAAFEELADAPRLIVDLRGNVGGTLVAAVAFRRRFLARPARVGSVRFSVGDGTLSPPAFFDDEPSERIRWLRPVRFLTDVLTYSASEDAILGLSQCDHVEVVGEPSGGGSGRPRAIPVYGKAFLTVSTALTYDHVGRCVERSGIAVDRRMPVGEHAVDGADADW